MVAAAGAMAETAFELLNDPTASVTVTVQVTPIFWTGGRGSAQNHSFQIAVRGSQVVGNHIETTA